MHKRNKDINPKNLKTMDLIIKARGATITIVVHGSLKVVSSDIHEIKFYISGEDNILEASRELSNHNIWHNPYPHYIGIPFKTGFEPGYEAEVQFNL